MNRPMTVPNAYAAAAVRPLPALPAANRPDTPILLYVIFPTLLISAGIYSNAGILPAGVFAGVVFLLSALAAPQIVLYLYFFMNALDQLFVTDAEGVLTPAKLIAPLALLLFLFRIDRSPNPMRITKPVVLWMMGFGLYGLIVSVIALQPLASLRYGAQIIVQALLAAVCVMLLRDRVHVSRACLCAALSGVIGATMMVLGIGGSEHFTRETLGEYANPNTTAMAFSVSILAALAVIYYNTNWLVRIAMVAAIPLILVGILKTGSRSAVVAVAAAAIIGPLFVRRAGFGRRFLLPIAIGGSGMAAGVLIVGSGLLGEQAQERITALFTRSDALESESRFYIWKHAMGAFLERPWGFGYGNTSFVMERYVGYFIDIHSTYFSALVDGGLISMILFCAALAYLFGAMRRVQNPNAGSIGMMMFMLLIISCMTHTIHFSKWFWIPLSLCMLIAEQDAREQKQPIRRPFPIAPPRRVPPIAAPPEQRG